MTTGWLHLHLHLDSETSGMTAFARGLCVRASVIFCLALFATTLAAQGSSDRLKKEATEAKKRADDERDRTAKKKAAIQLEFDALQKPDVRLALAKAIEPLVAKHRAAIVAASSNEPSAEGVESKPAAEAETARMSPVEAAIAKDCAAAVRDTARNLADVLDVPLARNLIETVKKGEEFSAAALVGESITEAFGDGSDFESAWKTALAGIYEKPLRDAEAAAVAAQSKVEDSERAEKNASSGIPPGMIEVPGGDYEIGDAPDYSAKAMRNLGHSAERKLPTPYYGSPKFKAKVESFFLDQNEVTNRMWAEFCRDTNRAPPVHWIKVETADGGADGEKRTIATGNPAPANLPPPIVPVAGKAPVRGTEDVPVTFITYEAATAFCRWCGRRLPNEVEWETAARFPAPGEKLPRRLFPFGDEFPRDKAPCNYGGALSDPRIKGLPKAKGGHGKDLPMLTPVGSWPESKSALGFNDLSGNAIELTSSPYLRYPGWALDKIPPGTPINEQFDDASVVMRGGHSSANDLMLMASVRRGFPREEETNSVVGFRTAMSKSKGYDLVVDLIEDRLFAAKLTDAGPALKDETKAGRFATLDFSSPAAFSAVMSGGYDNAKNLPARAGWIAVLNRGSREITDMVKMYALAKDQKEPLLLGWLRTDVPLSKPAVPAGHYWIMWRNIEERDPVTKKTVQINDLVIRSIDKKEYHSISGVTSSVLTSSTEKTKITIDPKAGAHAEILLSFPTASTGGKGRHFVQFKLEAAPGALSAFK